GPEKAELEQARTAILAGAVRGIERIGGFGGKADALAECTVFTGNPGCFREQLDNFASASARSVRDAGRRWLRTGDHTLVVMPGERVASEEERSEEHTSELQSRENLVCRLLLEKKKKKNQV